MERRHFRLGFAGFGSVGRALARLLLDRRAEIETRHGITFAVTLLASARRGVRIDPAGLDLDAALRDGWSSDGRLPEALRRAPVDLLFEATPLQPRTGEPALSHVRTALEQGMSVVTANKGPVAVAWRELRDLARARGAGFRFESTVADCLPVFNLAESALPVGRIYGCRGVLNSTSNHVLQAIAAGRTLEDAVAEMQRLGIAEADPSLDLDGWDQGVKLVILANVLLGRSLTIADVERMPVAAIDPAWLRKVERTGRTVRLIGEVGREGPARVRAAALEPGDFLATLGGMSLGLAMTTDLAHEVRVAIVEPHVEQTAYGMLADFIAIAAGRGLPHLAED